MFLHHDAKGDMLLQKRRFQIATAQTKRAYDKLENDPKKADCCVASKYDGKDFLGPRKDARAPIQASPVSDWINQYKKSIIPILTLETTSTEKFLTYLNTDLDGSHDATSLIEEMAVLNTFVADKAFDKSQLIPRLQTLIKTITKHTQHPTNKILQATCTNCKQQGTTHFNDNCNSVYEPDAGKIDIGTGPSCKTDFSLNPSYPTPLPDSTIQILLYVTSSAQGQIKFLQDENNNNLIVNVETYFRELRASIEKYEAINVAKDIEVTFDKRIAASNKVITEEMQPRIKAIHEKIDAELAQTVIDIQNLKIDTEEAAEEAKRQKQNLWISIGVKTYTNMVDMGAGVAALMGP